MMPESAFRRFLICMLLTSNERQVFMLDRAYTFLLSYTSPSLSLSLDQSRDLTLEEQPLTSSFLSSTSCSKDHKQGMRPGGGCTRASAVPMMLAETECDDERQTESLFSLQTSPSKAALMCG